MLISDLATIPQSVSKQLNLGPCAHPQARFEAMMAKYELLDLSFHSETKFDLQDRGGVSLLKELYFVGAERDPEEDDWCLEALEESIDDGQNLVKLFLRPESPANTDPNQRGGNLPAGYLPRLFLVEDACLTNANYVWMNKHFYL